MSDGDMPNLDSFLPFSLREVPLARAIFTGKKNERRKRRADLAIR